MHVGITRPAGPYVGGLARRCCSARERTAALDRRQGLLPYAARAKTFLVAQELGGDLVARERLGDQASVIAVDQVVAIVVDVPAAPDADSLLESDEMKRLHIDHAVAIGSAATDH